MQPSMRCEVMMDKDKPKREINEKKRDKRLDNLKPFQKGNPGGGRPKGSVSLVTLIKRALDQQIDKESTVADAIVAQLLANAMQGDMPAIKEILERIDGKVKQAHELGGDANNPIEVNNNINLKPTVDAIQERITQLIGKE
jgi:hypothetical protein